MACFVELIHKIKEGDVGQFAVIVQAMNPVINKYTKLMYKDEKEDIRSEFTLALWEAVVKIEYFDDEGKIINYLHTAIRNKFLELYRVSCRINDNECGVEDDGLFDSVKDTRSGFEDAIIREDMRRFLCGYSGIKKEVFSFIILRNLSDSEIAQKLRLSRQYTNRLRRELQKELKTYFDIQLKREGKKK